MKKIMIILIALILIFSLNTSAAITLSVSLNSPSPIEQGETTTITATISASGSGSASNVSASISLPTGLSTSDSTTKSIGTLSAGQSSNTTWTIEGETASSTAYTITVNASATEATSGSGTTSLSVTTPPLIEVSTTSSPITTGVNIGDSVSLGLQISNSGSESATVTINPEYSNLTKTSGSSSWTESLEAGSSTTANWSFTVDAAATLNAVITSTANDPSDLSYSIVLNTGQVCSSNSDCVSSNCSSDYDGSGAWCTSSGKCNHNGSEVENEVEAICYNDDSITCSSGTWNTSDCGSVGCYDTNGYCKPSTSTDTETTETTTTQTTQEESVVTQTITKSQAQEEINNATNNKKKVDDAIKELQALNVDISSEAQKLINEALTKLNQAKEKLNSGTYSDAKTKATEARTNYLNALNKIPIVKETDNIGAEYKQEDNVIEAVLKEIKITAKNIIDAIKGTKNNIGFKRKVQVISIKDRVSGKETFQSNFTVIAKNNTNKKLEKIHIIEVIPKELAKSTKTIKSQENFKILKEDPIIQWIIPEISTKQVELTLTNLIEWVLNFFNPGEEKTITYKVGKKITQESLAKMNPPIAYLESSTGGIVPKVLEQETTTKKEEEKNLTGKEIALPEVKGNISDFIIPIAILIIVIITVLGVILIKNKQFIKGKKKGKKQEIKEQALTE